MPGAIRSSKRLMRLKVTEEMYTQATDAQATSNATQYVTFTRGPCSRSGLSRVGLVSHERACGQTSESLFAKPSHDDDYGAFGRRHEFDSRENIFFYLSVAFFLIRSFVDWLED